MTSEYLEITYIKDPGSVDLEYIGHLPFCNSQLYKGNIIKYSKLTSGHDVKKTYNVFIDKTNINFDFQPGDAIGILPQNNPQEVDELMQCLNLKDDWYSLKIKENTTKKKAVIPGHIPQKGRVKFLFEHYLHIRSTPKKAFLKVLAEYTTNEEEKNELVLLSSPKSEKYSEFVLKKGKTLLTLLRKFPSCKIPLDRVLEHLPSLKPRFYSISSSTKCKELQITFSLIDFSYSLTGVCTSYLERKLKSVEGRQIRFYFRNPSNFLKFETEFSFPLILIGPGTGIAPFVGFLSEIQANRHKFNFSKIILFYGCRYKDRDFLFKSELNKFLELGILSDLHVAFSRETSHKVYVQDKIIECGQDIANLLLNENAHVRLCGDSKNLQNGVDNAIKQVLVEFGTLDKTEVDEFLVDLKKSGRYKLDIWL